MLYHFERFGPEKLDGLAPYLRALAADDWMIQTLQFDSGYAYVLLAKDPDEPLTVYRQVAQAAVAYLDSLEAAAPISRTLEHQRHFRAFLEAAAPLRKPAPGQVM